MAVKFMVLGAPRSGTSWAAAWLMTQGEHVFHDPFMDGWKPEDLDARSCGISCTSAVIQHREWVLKHPCPKVVLLRPYSGINLSLEKLDLPRVDPELWERALYDVVPAMHVYWRDLFVSTQAAKVLKHLTGRDMDYASYDQMRRMNVQPTSGVIAYCRQVANGR